MALAALLLSSQESVAEPASTFVYLTTGQSADLVLGQSDFSSGAANQGGSASASSLSLPRSAIVLNNRLFIADEGNSRLLGFNSFPATSGTTASFVVGQPDFTTTTSASTSSSLGNPRQIASDGTYFLIADRGNNRGQLFNTIPTVSNPAADVALGAANTGTTGNGDCNATDLDGVSGVAIAGSKVVATDTNNHRVLIWNSIPTFSNVVADIVLGQSDMTTCTAAIGDGSDLYLPMGVWTDGTKLIVADYHLSRVLIWNTFPASNDQEADLVLGQPDMSSAIGGSLQTGLNGPGAVVSNGTQVFVTDTNNNRVMIWNTFPTTNGQPADVVLGQQDFTSNLANDGGLSSQSMNKPFGVAIHDGKLLVSDSQNHRLLVFQGN